MTINSTIRQFILGSMALSALMVNGMGLAYAQGPGLMPGTSGSESGPIDIKANEQEFGQDHLVARGNVRVTFKDSVIVAPVATLYKDPLTGQPQRAVFTGHPHLVQGPNKIDADTLTFEMATSKIIAEGHAHSEVVNEPEAKPEPKAAAKGNKDAEAALAKAAATKGELDTEEVGEKPEVKPPVSTASGGLNGPATPTKIITDAHKQVYNKSTGQFEADGSVRVRAGDVDVLSDKLRLAYGLDGRPETAVFTGHVNATQGQNNTLADAMTYFLNTKRLQANGHVRSKVVQNGGSGGDGQAKAQPATPALPPQNGKFEPLANTQAAAKGGSVSLFNAAGATTSGAPIIVVSDAQDFNRESGRLNATGNVKIFYEDTIGVGPKVILMRNQDGQPQKVHFIGRSQITQPGKRWIADRITMTVADRKVLAEGNTNAYILPKKEGPAASPKPSQNNLQVAGAKRNNLF